jgi:hypothetical protein
MLLVLGCLSLLPCSVLCLGHGSLSCCMGSTRLMDVVLFVASTFLHNRQQDRHGVFSYFLYEYTLVYPERTWVSLQGDSLCRPDVRRRCDPIYGVLTRYGDLPPCSAKPARCIFSYFLYECTLKYPEGICVSLQGDSLCRADVRRRCRPDI